MRGECMHGHTAGLAQEVESSKAFARLDGHVSLQSQPSDELSHRDLENFN
jgi:hypothetical protein